MTDHETTRNPFILQCKKCNLVVADSFTLVDYKNNHLIFTSISTPMKVEKNKLISNETFDLDCTYNEIKCKCLAFIGKKYHTVNEECSGFAGKYCIKDSSVRSYMLGTLVENRIPSLVEICDEIQKIKRFCEHLHRKTNR